MNNILQGINGSKKITPGRWRDLAFLLVFGVVYLALVFLSISINYRPQAGPEIWLAGGAALAGLVISRRQLWPAILALVFGISFAAYLSVGYAFLPSLGFALVHCAEGALTAALLGRYEIRPENLPKLSATLHYYVLITLVHTLMALLAAGLSVLLLSARPGMTFINTWFEWWITKGEGVALVTPLLLIWLPGAQERFRWRTAKILEAILLLGCISVAGTYFYLYPQNGPTFSVLRDYLLFPFFIWAGLRFDNRFMISLLAATGAVSIVGVVNGWGAPVAGAGMPANRLLDVQLYLGVLVFVSRMIISAVYEIRQTSEKLSSSEVELRNLFQDASVGIFHFAPGKGFLRTNPALATMLGYNSPEELIASVKDISRDVFVDSSRYRDDLVKALQADGWVYDTVEYRRKDGSLMVGRLSLRTVLGADGGLSYLEGFVEDITDRRQVELALAETVQKFKSIVYSSPIAMHLYELQPDGNLALVDTNPIADRLLNISRLDILGKPIASIFPGFIESGFCETCRQVALGEVELHHVVLPYREVSLDGFYDVHVFQANPGFVVLKFVDVSETKLTEKISLARSRLLEFSLSHSLDELLEATLNEVEELTGSRIGFYHFLEADQVTLHLQNWSTRTKAEYCKAEGKGAHYPVSQAGVWVDCIREGRAVIHNDYAALRHKRGLPEGHAALIRELVVPVMRGDQIVAILGVGNKARDYTQRDVAMVGLLADLAWDVAERKKFEQALASSERLLNQTQAIAKVGGWEYDCLTKHVSWTREVFQIYGVPEDFDPNNVETNISFYDEPDQQAIRQAFDNAVNAGQSYDMDLHLMTPQGKLLWVRTNGTPVFEKGQVVKVIGTIMDISELKYAQASLARNEEQLRLAMEASTDGIWDWHCQDHLSSFNREYHTMLGYENGEIPVGMENWLELVHPDDLDLMNRTNADWLSGRIHACEIEIRLRASDGSYKWILSRGKVVKWDNYGKPLRIIGTHVDITERKQAEEALLESNQKLEKQIRANEKMQELLIEQATHDALTGLYNRRFMDDTLERELARARREDGPVAVMMLDIDHFKKFNDSYGHAVGDLVLIAMGKMLKDLVRESDIACRFGGEEFLVVFPGANLKDAAHRAELIRQSFCNLALPVEGLSIAPTISVGLAMFPENGGDADSLIRAADSALYVAKAEGRNCVRVAPF